MYFRWVLCTQKELISGVSWGASKEVVQKQVIVPESVLITISWSWWNILTWQFWHKSTSYQLLHRRSLPDAVLFSLVRTLQILLAAEVPLVVALELTAAQSAPVLHDMLRSHVQRIKAGISWDQCIESEKILPKYFIASLQHGYRHNALKQSLISLEKFLEKKIYYTQRIYRTLWGPIFTLGAALCLMGGVLFVFVPMVVSFSGQLRSAEKIGSELRFLSLVADFLYDSAPVLSTVFAVVIVSSGVGYCVSKTIRYYTDRFLYKLPLCGLVLSWRDTLFFLQSVVLLARSGVPLAQTFEKARKVIANTAFSDDIQLFIVNPLKEGNSLEKTVVPFVQKYAPAFIGDLIRVSFVTESFVVGSEKASLLLEKHLDYRMQLTIKRSQPLLMVGVGMLVLFLLYALYVPLLSLVGDIGQI